MDRDNKRARAAASSSQDVGNRSTLRDLPYGPLTDVAERLVSAKPARYSAKSWDLQRTREARAHSRSGHSNRARN